MHTDQELIDICREELIKAASNRIAEIELNDNLRDILDSLELLDAIMEIEWRIPVKFMDEEINTITTLLSLVELIAKNLNHVKS